MSSPNYQQDIHQYVKLASAHKSNELHPPECGDIIPGETNHRSTHHVNNLEVAVGEDYGIWRCCNGQHEGE